MNPPNRSDRQILREIAEAMDDSATCYGQWDGADVCDAVANLLLDNGYLTRCTNCTLLSAAHKRACPFCGAARAATEP